MPSPIHRFLALCVVGLSLGSVGCASAPQMPPKQPQAQLRFLDIDAFDRDLAASLHADQPHVEVRFFENVSPNAMPPRLQKWLQKAEVLGCKVHIDPPEGELTPRSPMALLSLFGTLFSSARAVLQLQQDAQLNAVRQHDIRISLERSTDGRVWVSRVTFNKRPT